MTISEINIQLVKPVNGLVAFASIVLDDKIYLGSIGVHQRLDGTGYRLTYPTKKTGHRDFHIFHPIERNLGQQIESSQTPENTKRMGQIDAINETWRCFLDEVRTFFTENPSCTSTSICKKCANWKARIELCQN